MKDIKVLGSVLVAGIAVVMAIGASSASANIDICLNELPYCSNVVSLLTEQVLLSAVASFPTITGSLNEQCTWSFLKIRNLGDGTLRGETPELAHSGCKPCTQMETKESIPSSNVKFGMSGGEYFLEWSGSFRLSSCPFGVECKFGATGVKLDLVLGGLMSSEFKAEKEVLTLESGSKLICGATGSWTANYQATDVDGNIAWYYVLL